MAVSPESDVLVLPQRGRGPGVIAIVVALLVAAVIRGPRVPLPVVMNIGLVFEVVGSYGIAAAEFLDPRGITRPQTAKELSRTALRRSTPQTHGLRIALGRGG